MKIFEPITVDLLNPYSLKKVEVQQKNIGRGVIVTLTAGGALVNPSEEDVKIWAKRPDGNTSYLNCTVQPDGTIRAPFSSQMLSVPGEVIVSLEMISGEDDITTPIFKVGVGENIVNHSAVESQNEFTALQEAISAMNDGLKKIEKLQEKAENNVAFCAFEDLPAVGSTEMLYVDISDTKQLTIYRWNGTKYVKSGIEVLDPNLVTKEGVAADALKVKELLEEQSEKLERKTKALALSDFENGTFRETLSDDSTVDYSVTFDTDGKPTKINDCVITW